MTLCWSLRLMLSAGVLETFLSSHGSDSLEGLPFLKVCFSIFVFIVIFVYFTSHTAGSQLKIVFTNGVAKGNAKD